VRVVKRGQVDHAAEREKHISTAILNLQANDGASSIAAALLAIETQFGRIADVLEGFYQLAKDDEI
jgi:hypothetical protein